MIHFCGINLRNLFRSPDTWGRNTPTQSSTSAMFRSNNFNSHLNTNGRNSNNNTIDEEDDTHFHFDTTTDNTPTQPDTFSSYFVEMKKKKSTVTTPTPTLLTEIELMDIFNHHKCPQIVRKHITQWISKVATTRPGFDFSQLTYRKPKVIMKEIMSDPSLPLLLNNGFDSGTINWLPDNKPIQIHFRSFQKALSSLLSNPILVKQKKFSFIHSSNPCTPDNFPELTNDTEISELHHGSWWSDTWRQECDPDSNQILVSIILYMDGISLDTHGKLYLTPLNMTLGIFNIETRTKDYAWETIYFHPCSQVESSR